MSIKVPKKYIPIVIVVCIAAYLLIEIAQRHSAAQMIQDAMREVIILLVALVLYFAVNKFVRK